MPLLVRCPGEILDGFLSSAMPLTLQAHEATEKQLYQYFTAMCHPLPPLVFSSTHPILLYCHCKDQEGGRKRERGETERLKGGGEGGR